MARMSAICLRSWLRLAFSFRICSAFVLICGIRVSWGWLQNYFQEVEKFPETTRLNGPDLDPESERVWIGGDC
jgi:hypothetical protein